MSVVLKNQILFVLGAPGSGKGMLCKKLCREQNFSHISVGDELRKEVQRESQQGEEIKSFLEKGDLVPNNIVFQILEKAINSQENQKLLVDGFPRNIEQAIEFQQKFGNIDGLIYLDCCDQILKERLQKSSKSGRSFDNEENIDQRIQDYKEKNKILQKYYQQLNKVYYVNAELSLNEVYTQFFNVICPNMIFFFGAPNTGKKTLAKYLASKINYEYINLDEFFAQHNCLDDNQKVNKLINHFSTSYQKYFVFDNIIKCTRNFQILIDQLTQPKKVFYLKASKDQVENNIRNYSKNKKDKDLKLKQYDSFLDQYKVMLQYFEKKEYFQVLNTENKTIQDIQKDIMVLLHPQILLSHKGSNQALQKEFIQKLENDDYINLNIPNLLKMENTENSFQNKLNLIRKIIFRQSNQNKYVLTDFSDDLQDYIKLEPRINYMISFQGDDQINQDMPQSYYYQQGKLIQISQENNDTKYLNLYTQKQANYAVIIGTPFCGKTTFAKHMKEKFNCNLIDYEKITTYLKEKLGGEDGPIEEVPYENMCSYFSELINNQKNGEMLIFDNWNFEKPQLQRLFEVAGNPKYLITLIQNKDNVTKQYRKKKEMDEAAEMGEDDLKDIENSILRIKEFKDLFMKVIDKNYWTQLYQFDVDGGVEKMLKDATKTFQKRVICCDIRKGDYNKYQQIFADLCQKQEIKFVDVQQCIKNAYQSNLKQQLQNEYQMRWTYVDQNYPSNYSPSIVTQIIKQQIALFKNNSKDIILFGYPSADKNLQRKEQETYFPRITDEINEISNEIGQIRSLINIDDIIQNDEQIKYNDPIEQKIVEQEVQQEEQEKLENEDEQNEDKAPIEDDGEAKEKKWNAEDFIWSITDGKSKDILKIYSKLFQCSDFQCQSIDFKNKEEIENQVMNLISNFNEGKENGYLIQIKDIQN